MTNRVLCLALLALCACGCSRHSSRLASTAAAAPKAAASSGDSACLADGGGYLRLRARGAQNFDIDWHGNDLQCEGGPRPDLHGVRLTFAARSTTAEHRPRLVLGIAAPIAAGTSHAVPVNVTLILEGENRLYSTRGDDKCTLDELLQTPIGGQAFRVTGRGFCSAPAAALDGGPDELVSRFDFAGRVVDADVADHPQ
jgi:hypothetical protein